MEAIGPDDTPDEVLRKVSEGRECKSCGKCCIFPGSLLPEEIDMISDFTSIPRDEFMKEYLVRLPKPENGPALWRPAQEMYSGDNEDLKGKLVCMFLSEDDEGNPGCTIYSVRPFMCRIQYCDMKPEERKSLIEWAMKFYQKCYEGVPDGGPNP